MLIKYFMNHKPTACEHKKLVFPQELKSVQLLQKDAFLPMLYPDLENKIANKRSDIWILLNLNRLDVTPSMAKMIDDRFASKDMPNPFKGMDDETLFAYVKGKNIQTPAENEVWLDYIENQISTLNSRVAYLNSMKQNEPGSAEPSSAEPQQSQTSA